MGRKKQIRPRRAGGAVVVDANGVSKPDSGGPSTSQAAKNGVEIPVYVEVDRSNWSLEQHYDVSEVVLTNMNVNQEFWDNMNGEQHFWDDEKYNLRFRLSNVNDLIGRIKLGHWPVLSANHIYLELVEKQESLDIDTRVMVSGNFDGPNEGVSGLVHLVNMKYLTLRPVTGLTFSGSLSSIRLRVEIQKSAFEACKSLFENTRSLWKKSMMNVMAWLRTEVTTSEARYGYKLPKDNEIGLEQDEESSVCRKRARFDVSGFYEAIKPSKDKQMLMDDMPDLLPELRPYQKRAAFWMVQREKGALEHLSGSQHSQFVSPLCTPVDLVDSCSKIYYNSFSGSVSMNPESNPSHVVGGILADEMGLGKTIELLACVFAHRKSDDGNEVMQLIEKNTPKIKRVKRERVECVCGDVSESSWYGGLWVQCDVCDAWQHADCVGFLDKGRNSEIESDYESEGDSDSVNGDTRKRKSYDGFEVDFSDEVYICQLCSELIQATTSPVASGATLVVCPTPILAQWHAEITRHTRPGSLKVLVYEGVKTTPSSSKPVTNVGELLTADIVLTTYDVLKEDLFHDTDRHEGDRLLMRYQKRYPVIPTLLTRIFWWRICLDEAQMVESNTTAATEMAMRLHAMHRWCITGTPIQRKLDDLYGLLRFLIASPYDVLRWWVDVIREPYEGGDAGAVEFTHNLFRQIMWRSSKSHVAEELMLPPQEECVSWLSFTAIEKHFYQRQHETCLTYAREVIQSFRSNISDEQAADSVLTHVEAAKLLNSLLKLRQACCHPQVGSSGLRALHQSPMTMEEILMVLVGKTKVEGEEALRKLVVAVNGLAGIAIIKQEFPQAISLYKEALELAEEHSEDFRVDPLLSIHIHYNLAEILPLTSDSLQQSQLGKPYGECSGSGNCEGNMCKTCDGNGYNQPDTLNGLNHEKHIVYKRRSTSSRSTSFQSLQMTCNNLKKKFLSVFNTRLSAAQQEFRKSYELVSNAHNDRRNHHTAWWAEALHYIEQNKEVSTDFIRKIGDAVSGTLSTSRTSRLAACFQSITALKYYIQTSLDSLEDSRRTLLNRLMELDQTMENPREEDVERVRYCPNCQLEGDGRICVHCELDELFQVYEARLFRLNKGHDGGVITSAEEAVDIQKRKSALNRFYWTLSQRDKASSSSANDEDDGTKRGVGEKVLVSKSPSELEVVLGILKSYSKVQLDTEVMSAAKHHLFLLEGMRKEYAQARSLAVAQAQVLNAHDELKMATSRLRLRENEDDKSIDALSLDELEQASVENSSEKFLALSTLTRIKGQLRYLKGLVHSKQHSQSEGECDLSGSHIMRHDRSNLIRKEDNENRVQLEEEMCPVCQERLSNQKMVFQCGHITCCKCFLGMTERWKNLHGKSHKKWVMCPTCRQHTECGNVAFVDDNKSPDASVSTFRSSEASVTVKGSYSTKISAVTRRILCIGSTNPKAKVLVFSSWNDVLDVLEHSFAANGITFIRMKGGRKSNIAISQFKGEKVGVKDEANKKQKQAETNTAQVLLILIQHGANGLNLLEAQHVILVEPLLNPAAEAQAISRVHRIGQTQKTLVHRFIVKDTVEESLYKLNKSRHTGSFISGNKKNQDQPVLTIKDVESLFKVAPSTIEQNKEEATSNLMHLPPGVAARIAAERRLMEQTR